MPRDFKSSDEGKRVLTAEGDMVGTIEQTAGSHAMVEPDEDLSRSIRRRLGWTEEGETSYRLEKSEVDSFSGDEIHLKESR